MTSRTIESAAATGRWPRAARAPLGLRRVAGAGVIDRAIAAADSLRAAQRAINEDREELVMDLRRLGASWESIGWVVGVTGAALRQQYGSKGEQESTM